MDRDLDAEDICMSVENLDLYYGQKQALKQINMRIRAARHRLHRPERLREVDAVRCFNRMNDLVDSVHIDGVFCWMSGYF